MNRNAKINHFIKTLKERELTLAFAESMTCGLATHMLSTCKGTADVLKGSIVCYNEEVKTGLMLVPQSLINKHSAESKQVTEALALKLKRFFKADIFAAITGLASAGGSETKTKPVGTVFFTIIYKRKIYHSRHKFNGTPLQIREKACLWLYQQILSVING